MNRGLELEGQRFGHLTVLKRLDERENRYIMWLCRCDCGNEIKVNTRRLVRGTVDNCGCILEKTARRGPVAEDLTGQRFGKLVAVRRIRSQNGRTRWECRCDCGNIHIVTAHALKAGKNFRGSFIWLMEPAWKCWKRENTAVTIPAVFVESTI